MTSLLLTQHTCESARSQSSKASASSSSSTTCSAASPASLGIAHDGDLAKSKSVNVNVSVPAAASTLLRSGFRKVLPSACCEGASGVGAGRRSYHSNSNSTATVTATQTQTQSQTERMRLQPLLNAGAPSPIHKTCSPHINLQQHNNGGAAGVRGIHTTKGLNLLQQTKPRSQGVTEGIDTPLEPKAVKDHQRLQLNTINPNVVRAKYAVRGELAIRAEKYRVELETKGVKDAGLPFDSVVFANIGNPQQLDQKPITFFRQVLSIIENPALLALRNGPFKELGYQEDVFDRAEKLLKDVGSVGAYSQSAGIPLARKSVAKFISERDGFAANPDDIFLTAGASAGVNTLLNVICNGPKTGVLVPIPQYPLYTATLAILNSQVVPYYLDETDAWATDVDGIQRSLEKARKQGTDVRAIAIINPGNPTGSCLSFDAIRRVLDLAARERLVVIADEVYQTNIFAHDKPGFTSFKKVLRTMQRENPNGKYDSLELVSLNSISKGMVGECGHRGGYFELNGFHPAVREQIYKFISVGLCPPVIGQCLVELMVNPPKPGDPSYPLYSQEYNHIKNQMKDRAMALYTAFKEMEGVTCAVPTGSMYLYPQLTLPKKAVEAAKKAGVEPDEFYCGKLLDATGICVVPGSGFGQVEGTFHLRTTFLAPGTEWVGRIVDFHKKFCMEYGER